MASIEEQAQQLGLLAQDVPTATAGWIDGELEALLQTALELLGSGHPLRIDLGTAVMKRQREAQDLRASLLALKTEIEGFARGLMG